MELDFDKYCVVDGSPTTVLTAPRHHSKVAHRKSKGKPKCGNDRLSLNENFREISFNRYRSASCRDVSRRTNQEGNELLKRGSVYQSSKEATLLRRSDDVGRKKIEFSRGSATAFSLGIIDSLCRDEDSSLVERNRSSASLSEQSTSSFCKKQEYLHSFCPVPQRIASQSVSSSLKSKKVIQDLMITSESAVAQGPALNLQKSLSAKLALPHSPAQSESDGPKTSTSKARFHPPHKILDPFVKPKSHRSSLTCAKESGSAAFSEHIGTNVSSDKTRPEKKEDHNSVLLSSPAHLHGLLKMEKKHGVPFFEFSVKAPEDVFVAKTCKVDKALNWVYTFHSLHQRRRSSASGWGFKESNRESSMIGQMHVSCYLCTELKGAGAFNESMVTEFVLYDIAHSRRSASSQDSSCCSPDASKAPLVSDDILHFEQNEILTKTRNKSQSKHSRDSGHFDSSMSSQPLSAVELHPGLEIAAIIMQVPFEKRESLKFKSGDWKSEKPLHNLLDLCRIEEENEGILDNSSPGKMHVVIPNGNHSLPSAESRGPSPLLDRWRLGGGCDCGGWDMACPLNICGNPDFRIAEGQPLVDNRHPAELFVQGRKDNIPTFTMRAIEDGKYAVDFHAQLSSLQAFSISVAILHAAEASTAAEQERSKQMLQSDSLRVFAEEEIKYLIDTVSEEEKFKTNKMEEVLPSFVVNPPFSPIARV
ncbi:hypothetical protein ACS0TY_004330 [Phlomoides rotata]